VTHSAEATPRTGEPAVRRAGRHLVMPGMATVHSHAFQRALRGRTQRRSTAAGTFWTWRGLMFALAAQLDPEQLFNIARFAFVELAMSGVTAVGEFHYLHHAPDGRAYDNPNLLAGEVIRAASDVGLRIALLRVAYARSGFQTEANPRQGRFLEGDQEEYLQNLERLIRDLDLARSPTVTEGLSADEANGTLAYGRATVPDASAWIGVAPHSVRAVPLPYLKQVVGYADEHHLKVHMHVAEQPAEVSVCVEEHGRTPFALLETEGLLSERFTAVHAIHVTPKVIPSFAKTGAMVCACPTTERNLGDGVVPADEYLKHGVPICLGTDSHTQIDLLEDARELEYHLRLRKLERAVLDGESQVSSLKSQALASYLFDCATINGGRSIGAPNGSLAAGKPADFFTVDLDDPSVAGAANDDLLAAIVFSLSRAAVREVVIAGKPAVAEGQHLIQEEVVERFGELQKRLWS